MLNIILNKREILIFFLNFYLTSKDKSRIKDFYPNKVPNKTFHLILLDNDIMAVS
jgi:hypothetical protein